jgi:hypothetical protein
MAGLAVHMANRREADAGGFQFAPDHTRECDGRRAIGVQAESPSAYRHGCSFDARDRAGKHLVKLAPDVFVPG